MSIALVELATELVSLDEDRFPDRDDSLIPDHLIYCCAKFDPLPAITAKVDVASVVVVRGHKYLLAARALGRQSVRVVVAAPPSSCEDVDAFLARKDVSRLDWDAIQVAESANQTPTGWHIFFFERSLSAEEKVDFEARAVELFGSVGGGALKKLHFDDEQKLAEFEAPTPVGDHAWASRHLATFAPFSRERARIISFQGRRFANFPA